MEENTTLKGKGRSRLKLAETEIKLLTYLEKLHLLTTDQIYRIYSEILRGKNQAYSFKNRIRKLEEYKLVKSAYYAKGFEGERFKYYSIWSEGINVLMERELLDDDYNKNQIYQRLKKRNPMHFLMTQEVVVNTLITIKNNLLIALPKGYEPKVKLGMVAPSKNLYLMRVERASKSRRLNNKGASRAKYAYNSRNSSIGKQVSKWIPIIRPDWILASESAEHNTRVKLSNIKSNADTEPLSIIESIKNDDRVRLLNIELDTGTEPWSIIEDKIWRYCLLAEKQKYEKHFVLFVLPDESFSKRTKYGNRSQRINNFINNLENDELLMKRCYEVQLSLDIVTLKEAGRAALKFLAPDLYNYTHDT